MSKLERKSWILGYFLFLFCHLKMGHPIPAKLQSLNFGDVLRDSRLRFVQPRETVLRPAQRSIPSRLGSFAWHLNEYIFHCQKWVSNFLQVSHRKPLNRLRGCLLWSPAAQGDPGANLTGYKAPGHGGY